MADKIEFLGKADLLYITTLVYAELAKYVKAVPGKQLSTEDFTTALRDKLTGIDLDPYATLNSPAFIGTPTTPTAVAGTNNTQIASTAFVVTAITNAIAGKTGIKFTKVANYEALPLVGESNVIYLVPKAETVSNNSYTEYFWDGDAASGHYERLGDTDVDLTDYIQFSDVSELSTEEVKAIWDSVFTS